MARLRKEVSNQGLSRRVGLISMSQGRRLARAFAVDDVPVRVAGGMGGDADLFEGGVLVKAAAATKDALFDAGRDTLAARAVIVPPESTAPST
jgi:hypothetical protein